MAGIFCEGVFLPRHSSGQVLRTSTLQKALLAPEFAEMVILGAVGPTTEAKAPDMLSVEDAGVAGGGQGSDGSSMLGVERPPWRGALRGGDQHGGLVDHSMTVKRT